MEAQSFGGVLESLAGIDFFTGILPFVITYTIFFFILRYIADNVLFDGWNNNKPDQFAAILAIAFAFFTADFILNQPWAAQFFSQYLGRLTLIIVGLLGLLAVLGFVGMDLNSRKSGLGAILAVIVLAVFSVSGGIGSLLPTNNQNEAVAIVSNAISYSIDTGLIFILLIVGLLYYTMKDPKKDGSKNKTKWFTPWGTVANPEDGSSD